MCFILILILFYIDYKSKNWIIKNIYIGELKNVFFNIDLLHIHNAGIAFGLFSENYTMLQYWILIIISSIITIFLILQIYYNNCLITIIAYSMIIGGSLGNLLDRILHKVVIDFIYLHISNIHLPIFNFADLFIFIGIILVIYKYIIIYKK